jgi:hypothetical protein
LELVVNACLGAAALLSLFFARMLVWHSRALDAVAAVLVALFAGAVVTGIVSRYRSVAERLAGIAWVWHYTFFSEQIAALELEVGWLRALVAALRARRAFDAHKAEGGQLVELARWRPDLEPFVAEAARSSFEREP